MELHNLVQRKKTGKLMVSAGKQRDIEKGVAYHLGCVKQLFGSGDLDENLVKNIDENNFLVNMDNRITITKKASKNFKYANVVSGGEGMTLVAIITRGSNSKIHSYMMIF